jgi:hypothetical protein
MTMKRHGLGVAFLGLVLASAGLYGMWTGWDYIQLERGWSLFIGGATAVSGGVVTIALGRVIGMLGRIADHAPATQASVQKKSPAAEESIERAPSTDREPAAARAPAKPPVEVDRYSAGGSVYVMYSDGSVEVQTDGRSQRYPSLAALRAETGVRGG